MGEEKSVLRLGGIAGLLAGVFVILHDALHLLLPPFIDVADFLVTYPQRRPILTLLRGFYLGAAILAVPLILALYQVLRRPKVASARFGVALGLLGLAFLAFWSTDNFLAFPTLHELYTAATTSQDRMAVVLLSEAVNDIFDSALLVGTVFLGIAFLSLGVAMLGNPNFGRGFAGAGVLFGVVFVLAESLRGVQPFLSVVVNLPFFIFLLLFGWKVYSLSRAAESVGG